MNIRQLSLAMALSVVWLVNPVEAQQRPMRFSLQTFLLDLPGSTATPGDVPIPLTPQDTNIELVNWTTAATDSPHTAKFVVKLRNLTSVGSIITYGATKVSYKGAQGEATIDPGDDLGRLFQIYPLSEGEVVESITVEVTARPVKGENGQADKYQATLPYLTLIPVRALNVARSAEVSVSSIDLDADLGGKTWRNRPETLVDGRVDEVWNFSTAPRETLTSPETPEWILLRWKEPQKIRGVGMLRGSEEHGFGQSVTEVFVGSGDPAAAKGTNGWKTVEGRATLPGKFRSFQLFVSLEELTTTALRIRSTGGVKQLRVGEIVILQDLGQASDIRTVRPLNSLLPDQKKASE